MGETLTGAQMAEKFGIRPFDLQILIEREEGVCPGAQPIGDRRFTDAELFAWENKLKKRMAGTEGLAGLGLDPKNDSKTEWEI